MRSLVELLTPFSNLNGFFLLFKTLCLFETGSIHFKEGSNAVFVYRIDNKKSLTEPFGKLIYSRI